MQSMPSMPGVDTDPPTNQHGMKPLLSTSEEAVVFINGGIAKNMSKVLESTPDVLREKCASEFWGTYKKVSNEYDDNFLERANDDMAIILTFAGLFSAVNSTFIVGMQPNPGNTTNALLLQLIQITVDGPNTTYNTSNLSSSTNYSSSTVWVQSLAYASLAFSVLAAFGAVLGKQWLNSYKAARGRGSLEERAIRRQLKLDGLEYFHLQTVLQAFLVLLQISLLLFYLSLSANMWTQETTISSIIICTTAFGILFYMGTIFVSVLRSDSPFQTPGSQLVGVICNKILPGRFTLAPNIFGISSAIRWILETSMNPEAIEAAAAMVPLAQWSPNLDTSAAYARLRDHFVACRNKEELYVKYGKAMAHLCSQSVIINPKLLWKSDWDCFGGKTRFIRDAFMAGCHAYHQLQNSQQDETPQNHQADARSALRTIVVHGLDDRLSLPNNVDLIWNGDLRWHDTHGDKPSCEKFDWLIDYLVDAGENKRDDESDGDALLTLSAMQGLGSYAKRPSYIRALIRCMHSTKPPRVRHAALRAVSDAQGELAAIISDSVQQGVDAELLDGLSSALLTAVQPNHDQTNHESGPDASFHEDRDHRYIRLILALTKNEEWFHRLTRDGHLKRCISLVDKVSKEPQSQLLGSYLTVIFGRINPSGNDILSCPAQDRWRHLITTTWRDARSYMSYVDYVDAVPAIVTATRLKLPGSDNGNAVWWSADLEKEVDRALAHLQEKQVTPVNDQSVAQATVDAAISSVQCLHENLISYRDNRG